MQRHDRLRNDSGPMKSSVFRHCYSGKSVQLIVKLVRGIVPLGLEFNMTLS